MVWTSEFLYVVCFIWLIQYPSKRLKTNQLQFQSVHAGARQTSESAKSLLLNTHVLSVTTWALWTERSSSGVHSKGLWQLGQFIFKSSLL